MKKQSKANRDAKQDVRNRTAQSDSSKVGHTIQVIMTFTYDGNTPYDQWIQAVDQFSAAQKAQASSLDAQLGQVSVEDDLGRA